MKPPEFDSNKSQGWTPLWYYAMAPSLSRQGACRFFFTCPWRVKHENIWKYNGFSSYDWCNCQPGRLQDFVVHANGVQSNAAHLQWKGLISQLHFKAANSSITLHKHPQTGDSTEGTSQRWYSMPFLVLWGENTWSSFVSHVDVVSIQFAGLFGAPHDIPHGSLVDHGGFWSLNPLCPCRWDQIHYKSCILSTNTLGPSPLSVKRPQLRCNRCSQMLHWEMTLFRNGCFTKAENTQKMGQRPRIFRPQSPAFRMQ